MGKPYRAPDPPPLPKIRVQDAPPFTVTGADFTGALHIRGKSGVENAYICLITCASTRAVHLKLFLIYQPRPSFKPLDDLPAGSHYLVRWSRTMQWHSVQQPIPYRVWLDQQLYKIRYIVMVLIGDSYLNGHPGSADGGRDWLGLPNPPSRRYLVSISQLWDSAYHRYRDWGRYERSITYVTSDASDQEPLTPAHLLYGRRITSLPHQEDVPVPHVTTQTDVTKRARVQGHLISQFPERWRHKYLTSLRQFHQTSGDNNQTIRVGDVVQIYDWSHHIKAHSEALPIRISTDVFFVAGRMSRRRRRPYLLMKGHRGRSSQESSLTNST